MRAIYRTSQFRDRGVVQVFLAVSHSGCAQKTWGILLFFPDLLQCARSGGKAKEYCVILFFSISLNCEMFKRYKMRLGHTHPPLLVLFPCYYNHLSFNKCQFVIIVSLAVVDRLHPPGFVLPLDRNKQQNQFSPTTLALCDS